MKTKGLFLSAVLFATTLIYIGHISFSKEVCKRPNWKTVYNNELLCYMFYNHQVLYETSIFRPTVTRRNNRCRVDVGHWRVMSKTGKIDIYLSTDLNIDHILLYNYIVNQVGCEKAKKYFNLRYNLEPLEASYNKAKSDKTCLKKEECARQKEICKKMKQEFGEDLNCSSL